MTGWGYRGHSLPCPGRVDYKPDCCYFIHANRGTLRIKQNKHVPVLLYHPLPRLPAGIWGTTKIMPATHVRTLLCIADGRKCSKFGWRSLLERFEWTASMHSFTSNPFLCESRSVLLHNPIHTVCKGGLHSTRDLGRRQLQCLVAQVAVGYFTEATQQLSTSYKVVQ